MAPRADAPRRGAALSGARLTIFGVHPGGAGCTGRWFLVGHAAWLCEDEMRLSAWPASDGSARLYSNGLPYRYFFVGADGSLGYNTLELAGEGIADSQLQPGFAVAVVREHQQPGSGEPYLETSHGLFLPARDLTPAQASTFQGEELSDGLLDVAWTRPRNTWIYDVPAGRRQRAVGKRHALRLRNPPPALSERKLDTWLQLKDDGWVRRKDLIVLRPPHVAPANAPSEDAPWERWLFVDTTSQTLTAYQGVTPVFATLVSTGRGAVGSETATPRGTFRLWIKLRSSDMTDLEVDTGDASYAIEEVPWVMFFHGGYGLHGAFWHDAFGERRSHGCINLSPEDARFLFEWTAPALPRGWHAVLPTEHDPGTRIIIE